MCTRIRKTDQVIGEIIQLLIFFFSIIRNGGRPANFFIIFNDGIQKDIYGMLFFFFCDDTVTASAVVLYD